MSSSWSRGDLPHEHAVWDDFVAGKHSDVFHAVDQGDLGEVLDAVVDHLNEHHPKTVGHLLSEAVSLRVAAEGRERQARDEVERLRDSLRLARAERDREADRAEQAERERDAALTNAERMEYVASLARDALTVAPPTVTRDEVEKAIEGTVWWLGDHLHPIADAVWALLHPEQAVDPVKRLAGQIEDATRQAVRDVLAHGHPVDAQAVDDSILASVDEDTRLLAAHALWQEAPMSISDRLSQVRARIIRAREGRHTDRHMVLDVDAPAMTNALHAVLDLCDEAADPPGVSGFEVGMAAMSQKVRTAVHAALGETGDE